MNLISPQYAQLNRRYHSESKSFGTGARHFVDLVRQLSDSLGTRDVLDYGCGKGNLKILLGWPIEEYDPGIEEKSAPPEPADIVICASVLEHVETDCMDSVIADLRRCTRKAGLFVVPHNPAVDVLPDGSNAHRTVRHHNWWKQKIGEQFEIRSSAQMSSITSNDPHAMMIGSRTYFLVT